MSRKTRIIISCILVVFAFGTGILTYLQANTDRAAIASGGTGFFVDGSGKIAVPAGGTDTAAKRNRGTEDNPFFVLEIAPWEGYAQFGYHIAGCEPVDVERMCWNWKNVYGENTLYTQTLANYYFWDGEFPAGYSPNGVLEGVTDQCGMMTYKGDGTGNYNLVDGECVEAANGDYLWEPMTVEECTALSDGQRGEYRNAPHTEGASFKECFENVKYYFRTGVKKLTHNNYFLRESIGLAYEMKDGVRVSLPEEKIQERIENYHSVVYTVTPEDLNMNLELIARADLITFVLKDTTSQAVNAYKNGDGKDAYFSHADTDLGRRIKNVEGANFKTNQLDWSTVVAIYERATDDDKACPVLLNTHLTMGDFDRKSVRLDMTFADGTTSGKDVNGTQNNFYKLYLLLYQMPSATLETLYGKPGDLEEQDMAGDVRGKDGNKLKTGLLKQYTSADANSYWSEFSLYPWELLPKEDSSTYDSVLDTFKIMHNLGADPLYHFTAGGANNLVQNGIYLNDGGTQLNTGFLGNSDVENDQYGYEVYDYFKSIGLLKDKVSPAECLYYLLNAFTEDIGKNTDSYKILELQPSPNYHTQKFWELFFATYANTTGEVTVDQMTTSEFIGKNVECISEYDLIYLGVDKLAADPTMQMSYTYAHTGPAISLPRSGEWEVRKMFGWLDSGVTDIENHFVYSGNDLTKAAQAKLKEYVASGSPLLFGNGFFSNAAATTASSEKIDRNSNIYDLQAGISNRLYEEALISPEHHIKAKTDLKAGLQNARAVELEVWESPLLYDETKSDAEKYINYYGNRTLRYKFTLKAPEGISYRLALYVDINGDGKFADEENIDVTVYAATNGGGRGNVVTTLQGGKTYIVERTVSDRVGSISWKLDIVRGSTVYTSLEGVSAIMANSSEVEDLCILQILPKVKTYFPCTVYLPQNGEVNGDEVTGVPDYAKEVTKNFYNLTRHINGMNIEFVRMTQDEVEAALSTDPNYLRSHYDMLIIGFADMYEGVTLFSVADAIEDYIASGRAVLFTHDSAAFTGDGGWSTAFTKKFRDIFGMDRYDVLAHAAKVGEVRSDYPYLPIGNSTDKGKMAEVVSGPGRYLLTQGFTNATLLRYMNASDSFKDGPFFKATKVSQVNKGAITEYPYKIPQSLTVAETHPQYYQLDLERGDVVVWYCLNGEDDSDSVVKSYYKATPNDVRNNYYIYNVGNVTYSGVGHSGNMSMDEIKLFINTFVAAYRATAKPVQVIIENDDAALNSSTGEYFMCVDVNSADAGKAFGNDIVETYQLQKAAGGAYELDRTETAQSKRVYFYIKNSNTYGDAEYDLTFFVDGTETPLAVFKKDGDVFMDTKTPATKFKASAADVYYVDVPLSMETADGKQAIATTGLKISIVMTYGYGTDRTVTDPSDTLAYIIPRGLFDLD